MEKSKVLIRIFCIALAIAVFCSSILFALAQKSNSVFSPPLSFSLVIDAGHGGIDGGAVGVTTGNKESDLNLDVAFLLNNYAKNNLTVTLTRQSVDGLYGDAGAGFKRRDMQKRKEIIQSVNPDIVVSIHMNKFPSPTRRGAQVYYQKGDDISMGFASVMQEMLNTYINIPKLNRAFSIGTGDFYICKIKKPTIIIECGFLSSPEDDKLLAQKSYRDKIAYTIYNGIISYFMQNTTFIPSLN